MSAQAAEEAPNTRQRLLIVLGGLPGTGKTTVGRALAVRRSAVYLRVDEIEQAIRDVTGREPGATGYAIAQRIARTHLDLGNWVVADSVNPVSASREGWRDVAWSAASHLLEVELVCLDVQEHRRRFEGRKGDISGLVLPTWASVQAHRYDPWTEPHLVVDTSDGQPADALAVIDCRIADAFQGQADALGGILHH